jgi:hypothetical protein
MNEKNFYKATFSQIHTSKNLNMEDYKRMKTKQKHLRKIVIAAASVCLIAIASTSVYAANMFGLKDMIIGNNSNLQPEDTGINKDSDLQNTPNSTQETGTLEEPQVTKENYISLQGFSDSNESKASAEWLSFTQSYDQDGALLNKVGNGPTGLDSKYDLYLVYTQEMADKLEEILQKYDLRLHTSISVITDSAELIQKSATGNFLGTANTAYSSYMYEDGTFHFDGEAALNNGLVVSYQFEHYKKGTFSDVFLNIGNIADYQEWNYKTASQQTVSLAISPSKSLIIADLGDSFITVNVLAGTEHGFLDDDGKITASDLEALAGSFDFSLIK